MLFKTSSFVRVLFYITTLFLLLFHYSGINSQVAGWPLWGCLAMFWSSWCFLLVCISTSFLCRIHAWPGLQQIQLSILQSSVPYSPQFFSLSFFSLRIGLWETFTQATNWSWCYPWSFSGWLDTILVAARHWAEQPILTRCTCSGSCIVYWLPLARFCGLRRIACKCYLRLHVVSTLSNFVRISSNTIAPFFMYSCPEHENIQLFKVACSSDMALYPDILPITELGHLPQENQHLSGRLKKLDSNTCVIPRDVHTAGA